TELVVVVPDNAITGMIGVVGDRNDTHKRLQIVPVITGADASINDNNRLGVTLTGTGFIENGGTYKFGDVSVIDSAANDIADVYDYYNNGYHLNGGVGLSVPIADRLFSAITVSTEGGVSAPFTVGHARLTSTAFSGAPADVNK